MAKSVKKEENKIDLVGIENKIDIEGIKEELKEYVDIKIKNGFTEELEKSNRRLIREKNKKILFKNIVILVLLVIIGLLLYLMYTNKYFNKYFSDNNETTKVVEEEKPKEEEKKLTLEELIKKDSYLLDSIVINEKSDYIEDYYSGNLTNELKHYLSFNNLDFESFENVDDYNIIESSVIEKEYKLLFDDKYEPVSFKYDSNKIRYMNKMDSFVTDKVFENNKSNIKREIINVKEESDTVVITCVEGLVKDEKLYGITSDKQVSKKVDLKKYADDLNKLEYTFSNGKLVSIKKL